MMKKSLLFLSIIACLPAFSTEATPVQARVDLRGNQQQNITAVKNCVNPTWLKPNPKSYAVCQTGPLTDTFQKFSFTVQAQQNGNISLVLESGIEAVTYRNISSAQTNIRNGDFRLGKTYWQGKFYIHSGNITITRKNKGFAVTRIPLKSNETTVITFEARKATAIEATEAGYAGQGGMRPFLDARAASSVNLIPGETAENTLWLKPNPKAWVRAYAPPALDEWQKGVLVFTSDQDCDLSLVMESAAKTPVLFRKLSAEGIKLSNSNLSGIQNRKVWPWEGKYIALTFKDGNALLVAPKGYAVSRIHCKKGVRIVIRYEFRKASPQEAEFVKTLAPVKTSSVKKKQ